MQISYLIIRRLRLAGKKKRTYWRNLFSYTEQHWVQDLVSKKSLLFDQKNTFIILAPAEPSLCSKMSHDPASFYGKPERDSFQGHAIPMNF